MFFSCRGDPVIVESDFTDTDDNVTILEDECFHFLTYFLSVQKEALTRMDTYSRTKKVRIFSSEFDRAYRGLNIATDLDRTHDAMFLHTCEDFWNGMTE